MTEPLRLLVVPPCSGVLLVELLALGVRSPRIVVTLEHDADAESVAIVVRPSNEARTDCSTPYV